MNLAWSWLDVYKSVPFVNRRIIEKHQLGMRHKPNAKKQAEQIRYCIQQAQEYRRASDFVSLATRPVLLYYSCMCLALAEVLFKQTGNSSLDVARDTHKHHGLIFSQNLSSTLNLQDALNVLRASPMENSSGRSGTFELWRRSATYAHIAVETKYSSANGTSTTSQEISFFPDGTLPEFPKAGISFFECISHLPWLDNDFKHYDLKCTLVRGRVIEESNERGDFNTRIIVHPGQTKSFESLMADFHFDIKRVSCVDIYEYRNGGYQILVKQKKDEKIGIYLPDAIQEQIGEVFFSPKFALNEFGSIYVGLFILSNLARYFPDKWMAEIERSSELSILVDSFLKTSMYRMSLLTMSELSDSVYLLKG